MKNNHLIVIKTASHHPTILTKKMIRRTFIKYLCSVIVFFSFGLCYDPINLFAQNKKPCKKILHISNLLKNKKPLIWLFTGDSITQGAKHTNGMRSFPQIFEERIRWELCRSYDTIINTAISGNTTEDIIKDFEIRIAKYKPDVVFLMIATNDAASIRKISIEQFKSNLNLLVNLIQSIGSTLILMTPTPIILERSTERRNIKQYVEKIREVALSKNIILIDNWNIWNNELRIKFGDTFYDKLLSDSLHPNGYGHKEIAIAILKELAVFDEKAFTCTNQFSHTNTSKK